MLKDFDEEQVFPKFCNKSLIKFFKDVFDAMKEAVPDDLLSRKWNVTGQIDNVLNNDSVYINQYFNELNVEAHYQTTGPEIWNQTNGKITHLIACSGTGGTISGIGRFLKDKNSNVKIIIFFIIILYY